MCFNKFLTIVLIVVRSHYVADSAKILAIVPSPSYSHQIAFRPIFKALSDRGHQITLVTADPMKDDNLKNIRQIDIHHTYEVLNKHNFSTVLNEYKVNMLKVLDTFYQIVLDVIEDIYSNPEVKELVQKEDDHFDLLMVEFVNLAVVPFTYKFKAPVIGMLSFDAFSFGHLAVGNPSHPVLYPDINLGLSEDMTFLERVVSTIFMVFMARFMGSLSAEIDVMVEDNFGSGYPPIEEQFKNIDMLFINSNPVLNQVRPVVPATVLLHGLHLQQTKPLPKELQEFLNNSKNGVVYFSLGTNVKSTTIPLTLRKTILETFAELPYDVLWKFEDEELEGNPENVKIMKWIPQQDLLKHPKIKLFITQGGIQSLEEAVYSHVPMVGIPFLGEQQSNVNKMVKKGIGLSVEHNNLDKETFKQAILEVISNKKYKEAAKKMADLALDQPMSGVEKAVWWTEYVLRHKGAKHLKGASVHLPTYQYFLLDVIGFLFVTVVTVIVVVYKILKCCFRFCKSLRKQKSE